MSPATASTPYQYTRLRFDGPSWQRGWPGAREGIVTELDVKGAHLWGVFDGRFGIASNELVLVTGGSGGETVPGSLPDGVTSVERRAMHPTARPVDGTPLDQPGLYVLRWFDVAPEHVDEFVELSTGAWTDFETDADFETRPVGLFVVPADTASPDRMLLVTWYDGFESWTRSRTPAPAARDRFVRRHLLTQGTIALATELVLP